MHGDQLELLSDVELLHLTRRRGLIVGLHEEGTRVLFQCERAGIALRQVEVRQFLLVLLRGWANVGTLDGTAAERSLRPDCEGEVVHMDHPTAQTGLRQRRTAAACDKRKPTPRHTNDLARIFSPPLPPFSPAGAVL